MRIQMKILFSFPPTKLAAFFVTYVRLIQVCPLSLFVRATFESFLHFP